MTIRSSEHFTFNNRRSDEFGILNVNMNSGMQSEPFASNRQIREQKIRGNDKPYFMSLEKEPYEFTLSFAFQDSWNSEKVREVARWLLNVPYYAPLVFSSDTDRIFYCMVTDSPELVHNSLSQGYINLHMRCADAYSYTSVYNKIYDFSTNPIGYGPTAHWYDQQIYSIDDISESGTVITFENFGDEVCLPLIEIRKVGGAGDVSIFNQSNGNAEFTMKNLANNETVTVDCENRIITTDLALTVRYDNLQGDYLSLPIYNNYLLVKGTCKIKFTYQLKRLQ